MTTIGTGNVTGQAVVSLGAYRLVKSCQALLVTQPAFGKRYSTPTPKRVGMYGWYGLMQNTVVTPPWMLWWKWIEFENEFNLFPPTTQNNAMNADGFYYFLYPGCSFNFNINY